jgi:hypothetical protein
VTRHPGHAEFIRVNLAQAPISNNADVQPALLPTAPTAHREAARLTDLGDEWRVLHSVPVGRRGSDLDHLVIGPPGVFVLNSKMRPDAAVKVIDNGIRVGGTWTHYLHASRHEAEVVRSTLDKHGFEVPVRSAIVFVGIKSLSVGQQRPDVAVLTVDDIVWWLRGQPAALDHAQVESLYELMRQRSTWQTR